MRACVRIKIIVVQIFAESADINMSLVYMAMANKPFVSIEVEWVIFTGKNN